MGRLILIVGNSGVGKTTLAKALHQHAPFTLGLEQHIERPFQTLMAAEPQRFALANQVDYLLLRAEQERDIRTQPGAGLIDGGLDLDFYGFTRLFYQKGFLSRSEFALCERLYHLLRDLLGPPDLILCLTASLAVIEERHARRGRTLEIAQREDLKHMAVYITDWLDRVIDVPIIHIDASGDNFCARNSIDDLINQMEAVVPLPRKAKGGT